MASNANERDTARPRFYKDAIQNMAASEKEGRPIFEEKEMVEVRIPGDKLFSWVGEVSDKHRQRWPDVYAAFKRGEERAASGTPLEQWPNPSLTKARVAELKSANILSVEELAGVPDSTLPKLGMGARELRDQARAYIDAAKGGAENAKMAAELAQLRQMVENLTGKAPEAPKEKSPEDCTDQELKDYIKRETGEAPRGNVSRETLLKRAAEIAQGLQAA
ncbi:hypothetical protein [Bradyrhizobium sp. USDA 3458]|uniref:hypothetical protein n=1 Tax=Bradyrhizobium sp. USDA 3458 TaxID=2591461 RepID=UPI00114356CF|nr:hypothetical protein [Bradyrhizobium sp. USDA 3458]